MFGWQVCLIYLQHQGTLLKLYGARDFVQDQSLLFLVPPLQCHLTQKHMIFAINQRTNGIVFISGPINGMIASSSLISSFALILQAIKD